MIEVNSFSMITDELISIINNSLNDLLKKDPEDYVLLLASGDYNEVIDKNKNLGISPYTISGHNADYYFDYTRQSFLCEFLNKYYRFLDNDVLEDDEYRMNIEFLIYTHIWEAKVFLKRLTRLANVLCGNDYVWEVIIPFNGKSNFIKEKIVKHFNYVNCKLGEIITNYHNTDLRNAIAHSDYQIEVNSKKIIFATKKGTSAISFDDWSRCFVYSICLSYHFSDIVTKRRKNIINDLDKNRFTIKMPFSDGSIQHVFIKYLEDFDDFAFVMKNQ
jgi:hypothetical protein